MLMDHHRLTSVDLVRFYVHRIKKLNPELNAIIAVSPTALDDARTGRQRPAATATIDPSSGSR